VLAQGQYWGGGFYGPSIGDHTVREVTEAVPRPAGRWQTPNLCLDCFDTGVIEQNGQEIPISTDPNYHGQASYGPAGPVTYVSPTKTYTTNAAWPNPRGGPEWIVPAAPAVAVAVTTPPVVYTPPAPIITAPVAPALPAAVTVASTTPWVSQVSQFAAPPVAAAPAAVNVVAPALYTKPAIVAAPVATVSASAYVAPPPATGHWETQTPPRFAGYENVRGVGVPVYNDYGGVPISAPAPIHRPLFGGGFYY